MTKLDERGSPGEAALPDGSAVRSIEPPPVLGTWNRLYWLVGGLLAAEIAAFWLLTRWAS